MQLEHHEAYMPDGKLLLMWTVSSAGARPPQAGSCPCTEQSMPVTADQLACTAFLPHSSTRAPQP